jgi:hypothetical protein
MPAIERLDSSNCANPVLDIYFRIGGVPINIYSLEFIIYEKVTAPPALVQTYPPAGRATVDVDNDCPTGHRLGTGVYVAEWDVPGIEPVGAHEIHWFWKQTAAHAERQFVQEFTVLLEGTAATAPGYCTVQDIRDEGIPVAVMSDTRAEELIEEASEYIDLICGRWFEARDRTIRVQARNHPVLDLGPGNPIIKVDALNIISGRGSTLTRDEISVDDVLVFNRHLTEGLIDPDDRDTPRIEYHGIFGVEYPGTGVAADFPWGSQVVEVQGTFGYTQLPRGVTPAETSDGSQVPANLGITPPLIRKACKLLTVREVALMSDPGGRGDWRDRWRLEQEKTVDQMYKMTSLSSLKQQGLLTGDPEIDGILTQYMAGPSMGAV